MTPLALRSLTAAALCAGLTLFSSHAVAQVPFYMPLPGELAGRPGTLIRQEPVLGAPLGAVATRILYRSTGLKGEPIAASGIVVAPLAPPSSGVRPVVVWAHPTTGVVPKCAPSLSPTFFQKVQGLLPMLERGYVVVAPDYPGLGTAGPHPYLVGESEGRAVLDAARAVRALPFGAGNRFAVWGHSQGGHAALYTGLLARHYAPDLELVGVAAAAPATELGTLMRDDYKTAVGKILTTMALWSWTRVFDAPIGEVVAADVMPTVNDLAEQCIESRIEGLAAAMIEIPLQRKFVTVPDITKVEPWRTIMLRNTPGALPRGLPLLMIQGTADTIVEPAVTEAYVARQCKAGGPVQFMLMSGIGHDPVARDTAPAAVQWMADRFAGAPAPDDCRR
ncbi:MAG: alpha/beta fold hydrolase [Pseudorhodoplanes sp.]